MSFWHLLTNLPCPNHELRRLHVSGFSQVALSGEPAGLKLETLPMLVAFDDFTSGQVA